MVSILAMSGIAVAETGRDIDGFAISLGIGFAGTGYNAINSNDLNLDLVPSVTSKFGLVYNINPKNRVGVYLTGDYSALDNNGFYITQGESSKNIESKADADKFSNAGGIMSGGGISADYAFKPAPSYGFGPYAGVKSFNVLTCSSIYKTDSRNMTCDYAKASSVDAGLSAHYYTNSGFNPYLSVGYTQLNFDNRPYQGVTGSFGLEYIFKPVSTSGTAALLIF